MKKYFILIFLFSFLVNQLGAQKMSKILPIAKNKIVVIAHRGDHTEAPENSLLAIQNAINDGADYVELDIRTSKDKKMVLMHDATVDRNTNGHGKIAELSFDTIRSLKLFNRNIKNSDTVQIPSFQEALNACKNKINIYLDFKDANVIEVFEAVKNAKMENQLVVYINAPNQFVDWNKYAPQVPLILSLNTKIKDSTAMFNYLKQINIDILDGNWNEYTNETVTAAKLIGVPVWADMQSATEDENYWNKGVALGLSGIQTDHPKELVQFIRSITKKKK